MSLQDVFIIREDIDHQHWTSDDTRYNVGALYKFAKATTHPEEIPLAPLKYSFDNTNCDEEKWSQPFIQRCQNSSLDFPILVVRDRADKMWIADGNHRYGKAVMQGKQLIDGYVIDEKDIPDIAIEPLPPGEEE